MRAFGAMVAVTAVAASAAAAFDPGRATDARNGDQVVCRNSAKAGTRLVTRICLTRAEWAAIAENGRRTASEIFDRRSIFINTDRRTAN